MGLNKRGGGALGIVAGAQRGLLVPSTAMAIGTPSATLPAQKVTNEDCSGLMIVADLSNIAGNGTIRPRISIKGPGDVNSAALWTGTISDGATTGLQIWMIYPQGLDTVNPNFTAANVRERASFPVPSDFWLDWIVATQVVTFSAEAYWLQ